MSDTILFIFCVFRYLDLFILYIIVIDKDAFIFLFFWSEEFLFVQGQLLSKFQENFELEMTFFCICCIVWLPRKWEKIEKKRKYFFFIWIFNIIADVDVFMWNFLIPRMETRESGKGNPSKCWGFHFNDILIIG